MESVSYETFAELENILTSCLKLSSTTTKKGEPVKINFKVEDIILKDISEDTISNQIKSISIPSYESRAYFPIFYYNEEKQSWYQYKGPTGGVPTGYDTLHDLLGSDLFEWSFSSNTCGVKELKLEFDGDNYTELFNIPIIINVVRDIIATATSTVQEGRSETTNLVYNKGKSRSDLIPGHTYNINAEYKENNKYQGAEGIGTLEMLKSNTITTLTVANEDLLTGNNEATAHPSENITLQIIVEDQNGNLLDHGYITVYDGSNIIQQNHTITGIYTEITFNSEIVGTHDIYAIYTDNGVEYNNSTSNHHSIVIDKDDVQLYLKDIRVKDTLSVMRLDEDGNPSNEVWCRLTETYTIHGNLTDANDNVIADAPIQLLSYNGSTIDQTTTNEEGEFQLTFTTGTPLLNRQNITITYNGTNTYKEKQYPLKIILDKLPEYTNLYYYNGQNKSPVQPTTIIPMTEETRELYEQGEIVLPALLTSVNSSLYHGFIINTNTLKQIGEKIYRGFLRANGEYLLCAYIDPELIEDEEELYTIVCTFTIINEDYSLVNEQWYYNEDAETILSQIGITKEDYG